jgi:hypothetical protein
MAAGVMVVFVVVVVVVVVGWLGDGYLGAAKAEVQQD